MPSSADRKAKSASPNVRLPEGKKDIVVTHLQDKFPEAQFKELGHESVGEAAPEISRPHSVSMFVPPDSTSAR